MKVLRHQGSQRQHLLFDGSDIMRGLSLKSDLLGEPGIIRLESLKQRKAGSLSYVGGATEYVVTNPVDFNRIQGSKKWYRKDGGANWFLFGDRSAGNTGLFEINQPSGNLSAIRDILSTEYDVEAPLWTENCDNLIIFLLDGMLDRPYCACLSGQGYLVRKLGLTVPNDDFNLTETHTIGDTLGIDFTGSAASRPLHTYLWTYTYSYGTKESPEMFGESGPGKVRSFAGAGTNGKSTVRLNGISVPPSGVSRINIYRTLDQGNDANSATFYKVGQIDPGRTFYEDKLGDELVDLSKVLPVYQGLPGPMRVALWHGGRLWWAGNDGRLRVSAAGFPDINPATFYVDAGNIGYHINWICVIRDTIFVGKEDGIYIIEGSVPNLKAKRLDRTRCYSRTSFAVAKDGVFFLGENNTDGLNVFFFSGNAATPIGDQIKPLLSNKPLVMKKAFGKEVHGEYWLSIPCDKIGTGITDPDMVVSQTPFNNLVLCYDRGYWYTFMIQASHIDVHNGYGDKGDIYFTEADNILTNLSDKGKLFRVDQFSKTVPRSSLTSAGRNYTKLYTTQPKFAVGPIYGLYINTDSNKLHYALLHLKDGGYVSATLRIFDENYGAYASKKIYGAESDSFNLADSIYSLYSVVSLLGTAGCITGSAIIRGTPLIRQRFNITDDKNRNGYIIEFKFSSDQGFSPFYEIDGFDLILENVQGDE